MIKFLVKLKKYILSNIRIRKLILYKRELSLNDFCSQPASQGLNEDISFQSYPKASYNILKLFHYQGKPLIKDDTACIVVNVKDEPAGCIFFDFQPLAKLLVPFEYEIKLGVGSAYIHGLFVEKKFRGRGLAKLLYVQAFNVLSEKFKNAHILTDEENFISNNLVNELGFKQLDSFALIKLFRAKLIHNTRNTFSKLLFESIYNLAKQTYKFIRLPIALTEKIDVKKHRLFFTLFLLSSPGEKNKIEVAYFCRREFHHTLVNRIFPNGYEIKAKKIFLKNLLKKEFIQHSNKVDLLIVEDEFNKLYSQFGDLEGIKFIPKQVLQTISSIGKLDEFVSKSNNKSLHNDLRAVKKNNYDYIFSKNKELFKFFYKDMYVPHITSRHMFDRFISPFNLVLKSFRKGGLILLKCKNRFLSGGVVELKNKKLNVKYFGVLYGDEFLLKKHVLSSLYYFCFKLAQENSVEFIDLGFSKGFLNDGVLRYKAKWPTKVEFNKKRQDTFLLKIVNLSHTMKDFLLNNPFISIEENGSLVGNIFLDDKTVEEKDKFINRYNVNGLNKLRVVILNGLKTPIKEEIISCKS